MNTGLEAKPANALLSSDCSRLEGTAFREYPNVTQITPPLDAFHWQCREQIKRKRFHIVRRNLLVWFGEFVDHTSSNQTHSEMITDWVYSKDYGKHSRELSTFDPTVWTTGCSSTGANTSVDSVARAFTDDDLRSDVVVDFLDAARECIDDAELVIPDAGIVSMLLNEEGVYEVDGVPVMDGVTTLVKTTETLVDLYEVNALATSKRRMYRPPDDDTLDELIDTYLADR